MKIILSGKIKDLFKNKVFNPEWYQAVSAGWELGKGQSQHDNFKSKKLRMLQRFLQENPEHADQYYGRNPLRGGLSYNAIEKLLPQINQEVAARAGYTIQAIQNMLKYPGAYKKLQELGILPKRDQPMQSQEVIFDPKIEV